MFLEALELNVFVMRPTDLHQTTMTMRHGDLTSSYVSLVHLPDLAPNH